MDSNHSAAAHWYQSTATMADDGDGLVTSVGIQSRIGDGQTIEGAPPTHYVSHTTTQPHTRALETMASVL